MNIVDSEGNELSKEQMEYFKNSKVIDDSGNLLVTLHYTMKEFKSFSKEKIGVTNNANVWGNGFYFTGTNDYVWSGLIEHNKSLECYLNIINPLYANEKIPQNLYEYIKQYEDKLTGFFSRDFSANMMAFGAYDILRYELKLDTTDVLKGLGYDGIVSKSTNEYIAFEPNQIKLITNKKPTTHDNINEAITEAYINLLYNK